MKIILSFIVSIISITALAQDFFILETPKGHHLPILDKLFKLEKKVVSKEKSTYTIKCVFTKGGGYGRAAKGHIEILDSRNDEILLQSKTEKGMRSALQGMKNPNTLLVERIAKKQLEDMLKKLESSLYLLEINPLKLTNYEKNITLDLHLYLIRSICTNTNR